jgi:hypothetical protein
LRLRPFWSFVGAAPSLAAAYVSVINSGASAPQVLSVSPAGSLAMPRELHTAMLLNNRTVRIAGGVTLVTFSLAAELFDPRQWRLLRPAEACGRFVIQSQSPYSGTEWFW